MTLEKDTYFSQLDKIQSFFNNAIELLFTKKCSCEETSLHSFFVEQRADSSECIYFDGEPLSEREIMNRNGASYDSFIQQYLTDKLGWKGHILKKSDVVLKNGSIQLLYWTLSSECLNSNHGTLVLNCFLQQLVDTLHQYIDEETQNDDSYIQTAEFIRAVETDIDICLQEMFEPFKIDLVNNLSGEYYEKSECQSNIIFLPSSVAERLEPKDFLYTFEDIPFLPINNRLIRKLLQITQDDLYLILGADKLGQAFKIKGICNKDNLDKNLKKMSKLSFPYLRIIIRKHMLWNLYLNNEYILTCQNGHYKIERDIQEEYLLKKLNNFYGEQEDRYEDLINGIIQLTKQAHGAILIILKTSDAQLEAKRLGNLKYGFAESNPKVQEESIKHLSNIDGSIIVDTYGKIHGIGMILDGISTKGGNPERGSRYNSVIKYPDSLARLYSEKSIKGMAVVISDDGFVNILDL